VLGPEDDITTFSLGSLETVMPYGSPEK